MKYSLVLLLFLYSFINIFAQNTNQEFGLFLGAKYIQNIDQVKPSVGLNYEYKFLSTKPSLGIGAIADVTMNKKLEMTGGIALYIHPTDNLRFFIAPGVYYVNYGVAPNDPNIPYLILKEKWGSQIRILVQAGTQYDFQLKDAIYLSPFIKFEKLENDFRFFLGVGASYKI